ncbi:hypothetical protein Cgig2_016951 [Carnegiea gigantea]|uniref:Uncharacterized protein n=1 Tax=Carnegiea gigantea TaxID=171969 RepID=A0A9Q1Q583_9CARY|nr:hypothetical protein Cgig2_016951 [Carnegiea gigantea]
MEVKVIGNKQTTHQCIHCLRRNGVNTLENGSSVKKIMNSTRPVNKPSMPRSDKPTFLQLDMLARGHGCSKGFQIKILRFSGWLWRRSKGKRYKRTSHTRVELEVELNATRKKKNEVLVNRVTTVETENENLRNCVESIEAEMGKFKDWISNVNSPTLVFNAINICINASMWLILFR